MSIEVVRSEESSLGLFPCALCRSTDRRVWRYYRCSRRGVDYSDLGSLYMCEDCAPLLSAALPTPEPVTAAPEQPTAAADETVNHPAHYQQSPSGVECITVVEHLPFCIGNAIKYLWRCDHKGGIEDLKKSRWYVDREIARRERLTQEGGR